MTTPDAADDSESTSAPCASAWPPVIPTASWRPRSRRWRGTARDVRGKHIRRLAQLADEFDVVEVVVGLPRTLADRTGPSALDAIAVADALAARIAPVPVRLSDERLTTVTAQRSLREAGVRAKGQKSMIDQAAAVGILQTWLDQRRVALAEQQRSGRCLTTGAASARSRKRSGGHAGR